MKKVSLSGLLFLSLIMTLVVSGCAGHAAGQSSTEEGLSWPTPVSPTVTPTRTPFPVAVFTPRAALKQVATATATAPLSDTLSAAPMTAAAPSGTPQATATLTSTLQGQVNTDALNLRQGPGTSYAAVTALHRGDQVAVLARSAAGDWLQVSAGGRQGWVAASLLTVQGDTTGLPEGSAPPAPAATPAPAAAAPAAPAARVAGGRMVVQLASGGDLMVIENGSAPRRLTDGMDPALSPDGRQVAFTRWQGDAGSLWVIGVDGRGERQLVSGLRKAKGAEWSPDGQRIVFNYQHEGRLQSQWVCKPYSPKEDTGSYGIPWNATDVKVRVFGRTPYLCWTIPSDEHWALHVVSSSDGKGDDLYAGMYAFRPTWDPVRTWRIVDEAGDGLRETSVNADHTQKITDKVEDHSPVFSPDGQYLAVTYDTGGRWDIFRLNADGSGRVRLTDMPLWNQVGPDKQQPWNNVAPAWSPDGRRLAYLTDRTGRWEIWSMNTDGSDQRPLFDDATNASLPIKYDYNDERVMSWR